MSSKSYNVHRINKQSFIVEHEDRCYSQVTLDVEKFEWRITVDVRGKDELRNGRKVGYTVPAYDCNFLIDRLASGAMIGWISPKYKNNENPWFGARDWGTQKIKEVLAKRVAKYWRQALEESYPKWFLDLHKRVFSVTYRTLDHVTSQLLLDTSNYDPYLVSDIMNYRAAAHAMLMGNTWEDPDETNPSTFFIVVGSDRQVYMRDVLEQWTAVYDVDHVLNRSKRRTLMNLPARMSTKMLRNFQFLRLDRPLRTKQEITWACAIANKFSNNSTVMGNKSTLYPTSADLNNAIRRYGVMVGEPMSVNKTKSYGYLAQYILDAALSHVGRTDDYWLSNARTVTSLFKTAEDMHREINRQQAERYGQLHDYDLETETTIPPVPLPVHKAITFLDTAGAIANEGRLMQHCVSGYAGNAIKGGVYIFHIEYKGTMATAAVSSHGNVQCHGPRNRQNKAAKLGQRVLKAWAIGLALEKVGKSMSDAADAAVYMGANLEAVPRVRDIVDIGDFAEVLNE